MTPEERIERTVERETNRIDQQFINGKLSLEQYTAECRRIDEWATEQYQALAPKFRAVGDY